MSAVSAEEYWRAIRTRDWLNSRIVECTHYDGDDNPFIVQTDRSDVEQDIQSIGSFFCTAGYQHPEDEAL